MRITLFGATGGTGRQVIAQARDAGHRVTAVVRDPAALQPDGGWLTVVRADVTDPESIAAPIEGADAVVSALGPRPGAPATICGDGARTIVEAMEKTGVRRLVAVSASGPYVDAGDGPVTRYVAKPILQRLLRAGFADLKRMEEIIRTSGLDWTIMRPPRLTNKPLTDRYRTAVDLNVRGGMMISRADLAAAILHALGDPATVRHSIGVGY
jgi:putative NADH-flavin reductase